ncbi:hypothetical protein K353_04028 [Kitasatospora sp. SolWspMP-SS2h]|uniref:DUF5691 domain-containing protein n=1 Tax=Kitasatospora sp. SolWspMP-SS2h TaxID=1305729 RepID=UPI000DB9E9A2|nr:DUF5691 domain-containing protein [Kitasatospora sp. SolWspMP-SS2h]RAJ38928.1 hypothetical protein K353_04028 [Kitasatospora sp. SolWspMP-SS2h]
MTASAPATTDDWAELESAALLGTDRRPLPEARTPLAAAVDRADPAGALLDLAAVAAVRRRAGALPAPAVEPPAPAPADPRPALPEAAARRLAVLLGTRSGHGTTANLAELLPQWLAAARARGYRLPPALVPALLDTARARSELRSDAVTLAGPLGRWLAPHNPDWKYVTRTAGDQDALDQPGELLWQEGLFAERVTHLTRLRRTDPAAGLALLASTWGTERAEDRVLFLDSLQDGLSAADEEFLEAALSDRSKNVRATAAELLSTLPGSALAARMAARARAAVRDDGDRLHVTPPTACDAAMQRDGIPVKSPTGRGERAWWFGEVVAGAPLALWTDGTGRSPEQLLALPTADSPDGGGAEWAEDLREAWARAAVRQQDAAWARALLGAPPRPGRDTRAPGAPAKLLAVLPPAERAAWTAAFVQTHGLGDAFQLLGACATPWTPPLSTAVVAALKRAAELGSYPWSHSGVLGMTERALAPETAPAVEALVADTSPDTAWADTFTRLAGTLRFRQAMLAELE